MTVITMRSTYKTRYPHTKYPKIVHKLLKIQKKSFHNASSPEERLILLQCYAGVIIRKRKPSRIHDLRTKFNEKEKKYRKKCEICKKQPHHRHHIIQIQHGGTLNYKNIAYLCAPCHIKIHTWL